MDFEVILGMDWLARHYAILDCRDKQVIFRIPGDSEFGFRGEQIPAPSNLISAITARRMLRQGCQGYLALVRDTAVDRGKVDDVPIACEFPDVFPEELPGLPPDREIEFCIDVDTPPLPYRRQACRPLHRNPQPLPLTTRNPYEAKPYCLLKPPRKFFFYFSNLGFGKILAAEISAA